MTAANRGRAKANTAAGFIIVRRSDRDRGRAIESAANAITRSNWWWVEVVQDEQDVSGIWHFAVRVRTQRKEEVGVP